MRVLVTGAYGFVAWHLVPYLVAANHEVIGTVLGAQDSPRTNVDIETLELDVTNREACKAVVRRASPTHIVHLAAASSLSWSFTHPEETRRVNVEGTQNILTAAAEFSSNALVLIVGSGEEYGPNNGTPLVETPVTELRPISPYAASKVEVERLVEANPAFRTRTVRTRSFPHIGPGQKFGFFTADVASQLARIETRVVSPVLKVGNLDAIRDYTDVRDVVRAYALLLECGVRGEVYNVSSSRGQVVREILNTLVKLSGVTVRVKRDPEKMRPSEIPVLIGDNTKLRRATDWSPEISLGDSLNDILAWWREKEKS